MGPAVLDVIVRLKTIVPPHGVQDRAKLAALVEAYEDGQQINPPVVLVFGGGLAVALSGSHRLAALRKVYDETEDLDEDDPDLVLVDGDELLGYILFTAYPGRAAPREPWELEALVAEGKATAEQLAESWVFWSEHALSAL